MHLACKHRIAGHAVDLRALDLAVPVGALDEPQHEPALPQPRERDHPVDHRPCPLLVRLHDEAQSFPTRERRIGGKRRQQIERELEPIRFLGIDREADVVLLR